MKEVQTCHDLQAVRYHIDRIDRDIVAALAERGDYVKQAAAFKRNEQEVQAPQRVEEVIAGVRALAQEKRADPDVVEQVYRAMITAFIDAETRTHRHDSH
ncbi:chorismate mutase [Kushneria sp. AK178]